MNESKLRGAIRDAYYWEHILEGGAYLDADDIIQGLVDAIKPIVEEVERSASEKAWKDRDSLSVSHSVRNPYEKIEDSILLTVVETSRGRE